MKKIKIKIVESEAQFIVKIVKKLFLEIIVIVIVIII